MLFPPHPEACRDRSKPVETEEGRGEGFQRGAARFTIAFASTPVSAP
jgi:hypothetical protein